MDNLAREAMIARQSGMTYGQWKASQPIVVTDEYEVPEGWRKCEYCGKLFKKHSSKRFCDLDCREKNYAPRLKVIKAENERKRRLKGNGKVY